MIDSIESYFPTAGKLIIKRDLAPKESPVGIALLDSKHNRPNIGTVLRVGSGMVLPATGVVVEMPCKAGDRVLLDKFAGTDMRIGGEDVLVIDQDNVIAIFEG